MKKLKITVERLREIVVEELEAFPGWDELATLANGVTQNDELDEFNRAHDSSGRFSSDSNATCRSSYFDDGERSRVGGSLTDKNDTGRGKEKYRGKGRFKCKDNERVSEGSAERDSAYIKALVRAELEAAIAQLQARSANSKTECTPQDLLKFMNRYSKASEGSLGKKG